MHMLNECPCESAAFCAHKNALIAKQEKAEDKKRQRVLVAESGQPGEKWDSDSDSDKSDDENDFKL